MVTPDELMLFLALVAAFIVCWRMVDASNHKASTTATSDRPRRGFSVPPALPGLRAGRAGSLTIVTERDHPTVNMLLG